MLTSLEKSNNTFIDKDGELTSLIIAYDWSATSIGTINNWPSSLLTVVRMLLESKFPMFLFWGDDHIQFYNDAYRQSLGNNGLHPTALGQKGAFCWGKTWETVKPMIDQVKQGAASPFYEDQLIPIFRNGGIEDAYWTFSYSAVRNESNDIEGVLVVCQETTNQVKALKQLIDREKDFYSLIMQAPSAIALFKGLDFVIEVANDSVLQYWRRTRDQVIGKPLFEALPEASGQGFEALLKGVYETGIPFLAKELSVDIMRDGRLEKTFINFIYQPYYDANRKIIGVIVFCNEVTDNVVAQNKMERLITELKVSNEKLENFAYAASHDLKEPIRKIKYFADRITQKLHPKLDTEDIHSLERLSNASQRMFLLVDNLLEYSQLNHHNNFIEKVDLNEKVKNVIDDMELQVSQSGAKITVGILPIINGYHGQIRQLFQNLISNAIKFHSSGKAPEIEIRAEVAVGYKIPFTIKEEDKTTLFNWIKIIDNGIGLEKKDFESIFLLFHRLNGKSEYEGTGMGLSLVKKIVENHKGYVWVESSLNKGATFNVLLP